MVDNEKLSLCCSEEGRYLLLWGRGVCGGAKRREKWSEMKERMMRKEDEGGEEKARDEKSQIA